MTYFHPRDFDFEQPMVPGLSVIRKIKSYTGLKGSLNKLEKLITNNKFIDLQTADFEVDWSKAKVVKL
jgi:peptidoglycan-N-acetylglucosamine deacetylase